MNAQNLISEDALLELTRATGQVYADVQDGVGTDSTPGGSLFGLAQVSSLATRGLPAFGALVTAADPDPLAVSASPSQARMLRVGAGTIAVNGQRIRVPAQEVPIAPLFSGSDLTSDMTWGVRLGLPFAEAAKATQVLSTTVSQTTAASSRSVRIADASAALALGFPLTAQAGTRSFVFSALDATTNALIVDPTFDPSYGANTSAVGTLGADLDVGQRITFLYDPRVRAVYGTPVGSPWGDTGNPASFTYFPPLPEDWLPIADVLARNPLSPTPVLMSDYRGLVDAATVTTSDIEVASVTLPNITLSAPLSSLDGVALSPGSQVLLRHFTDAAQQQNGVYVLDSTLTQLTAVSAKNPTTAPVLVTISGGAVNGNATFLITASRVVSLYARTVYASEVAQTVTLTTWDAPELGGVFGTDRVPDTNTIRYASAAAAAVRQAASSASVSDLIRALEEYTLALPGGQGVSFRAYWATRPFRPLSVYSGGLVFDGWERLEWPYDFARAYFAATGSDLQHTFAVVRGDLYGNTSLASGGVTPTVSGEENALTCPSSVSSSLAQGAYFYSITSVRGGATGGETAASSIFRVDALPNAQGAWLNHLYFTDSQTALFHHVYRRSSVVGDLADYRLTTTNQVVGTTTPLEPFVPGGMSTTEFVISSAQKFAFRLPVSADRHTGGFEIYLRLPSGAATNGDDGYDVAVYAADSGGSGLPTGSPIATGSRICYRDMAVTSATKQVSVLRAAGTDASDPIGINLTAAAQTAVWVVLTPSAAASSGSVAVQGYATGTAHWAQDFGVGLTLINNQTARWRLLGFIDNGLPGVALSRRGIKMTGRIALAPRTLRIYVPPMDSALPGTYAPEFSLETGVAPATDDRTRNGFTVSVTARLGAGGTPQTLTATVPAGTQRGTAISLAPTSVLVDRVDDVQVTPILSVDATGSGAANANAFSVYDLFTIETAP